MLCRRWEAAFLWLGKSTNGGDGGFRAKQRYDKEVLVGCSFSSHSIFADSHPNLCIYIHPSWLVLVGGCCSINTRSAVRIRLGKGRTLKGVRRSRENTACWDKEKGRGGG